ncbi:unnamed protein product [Amoebophrya sp. A25]|nr:unnamed protein product [Amoebophrya sp. A25]|eukprot:GSA25T00020292001.1
MLILARELAVSGFRELFLLAKKEGEEVQQHGEGGRTPTPSSQHHGEGGRTSRAPYISPERPTTSRLEVTTLSKWKTASQLASIVLLLLAKRDSERGDSQAGKPEDGEDSKGLDATSQEPEALFGSTSKTWNNSTVILHHTGVALLWTAAALSIVTGRNYGTTVFREVRQSAGRLLRPK